MQLDPNTLMYGVYATVFLAVALASEGAIMVFVERRGRREAIRRRVDGGEQAVGARDQHESLRRRPDDAEISPVVRPGLTEQLDRLVRQGGLVLSGRWVVAAMAILSLVLFVGAIGLLLGLAALGGANVTTGDVVALGIVLIAAIGFGVGAPLGYLRHRRSRRLAQIAAQLPEALDIMVRSLRAGHPITAALAMVSRDLTGPLSVEFGTVVDEMTYGLDLRQALSNLGRRVDLHDLRYVVVSVTLQHETGGNLAEILEGLATVVRARSRLARKIRSLSAEARLSAKILVVLPFVFGALVFAANPSMYLEVAGDPLFMPVLAAVAVLEVAGLVVMQRLTRLSV